MSVPTLHFCVAGAGVAGLATAIGLARAGHRVSVFERRTILDELGAGLQLAPNATRAARSLGVLEAIEGIAIESQGVRLRRASDGAELATIPLGATARRRYGAPFLLVHRADLQQAMVDEAQRHAGIELVVSTAVTASGSASGTVTLDGPDGSAVAAFDGIVRADGLHSVAPSHRERAKPTFRGMTAWRALIPASALPAETSAPQSVVWLGPRAHVVHYPVRNAALINVIAVVEEAGDLRRNPSDIWAEAGDRARLREGLGGWHRTVGRIVDAAPVWRTWPLFDAAPSVWSTDRETVVGDAAHPMLPFLAQGASQAFEDAAALRAAVAECGPDVVAAFQLYVERRQSKAQRVQAASRRQGRIYHLAGPAAWARDCALRALGPTRLLARMDWLYDSAMKA